MCLHRPGRVFSTLRQRPQGFVQVSPQDLQKTAQKPPTCAQREPLFLDRLRFLVFWGVHPIPFQYVSFIRSFFVVAHQIDKLYRQMRSIYELFLVDEVLVADFGICSKSVLSLCLLSQSTSVICQLQAVQQVDLGGSYVICNDCGCGSKSTRVTQALALVSTYQGSILVPFF